MANWICLFISYFFFPYFIFRERQQLFWGFLIAMNLQNQPLPSSIPLEDELGVTIMWVRTLYCWSSAMKGTVDTKDCHSSITADIYVTVVERIHLYVLHTHVHGGRPQH